MKDNYTRTVLLLSLIGATWAGARQSSVCYEGSLCFNNDWPFDKMPLPYSPSRIDATFALYTRSNRNSPQYISSSNAGGFSRYKQTKVLIHGFNTNSGKSPWMPEIKDKLLNLGDFNVILVDWGNGAETGLTNYDQAASNTRLVGPLLVRLLQGIGASLGTVHCIGHSLGAHTCGYAGAAAGGVLQRITGLDPAGPNFRGQPTQARLDPSDAKFVDNIHTHGQNGLFVNFGIGENIGDVDFFPNGGGTQPGCWNRRRREASGIGETLLEKALAEKYEVVVENGASRQLVMQPRGEGISCSHARAYELFSQSISSSCSFLSYPCSTLTAAKEGQCNGCGAGCQRLGYFADQSSARGIFYLSTSSSAPYC